MAGEPHDNGAAKKALGEFAPLWNEQIRPRLQALEVRRKRAVRAAMLTVGGGAVFIFALWLWLGDKNPFVWLSFVAVGVAIFVISGLVLGPVHKKAKNTLLQPVLDALGYRYQDKGFDPAGYEAARRFSLLPSDIDRRGFEDWIEGEHEGARFQLYEAKLQQKIRTKNSSSYVTVFRGVIGRIDHDSSALGVTVFTRDKGWFDGLSAPRGMKQAKLVASAFEDIFTVYTTDQVEARYLLPPNMMEHLVALERDFQGRKIRGAFYDGGLMFLIETKNLFEPGSILRPMDDPSRFENLIGEIRSLRSLIHELRQIRT